MAHDSLQHPVDRPEEIRAIHKEYRKFYELFGGFGLVLLFAAMGMVLFANDILGYSANIWTDIISIAFAVFVLDRRAAHRAEQEEKQRLILQMGSTDNAFALEAVRVLRMRGWLQDGSLEGVNLQHADLRGADLLDAHLRRVNLSYAKLDNAKLDRAHLDFSTLSGVGLSNASLNQATLQHCILRGAKLGNASLQAANLDRTNLDNADLTYATAYRASFKDASLLQVRLHYAQLSNANFHNAQLGGADFSGATLTNVNLQDARLPDADTLFGMAGMYRVILPDGSIYRKNVNLQKYTSAAPSFSFHGAEITKLDHTDLPPSLEDIMKEVTLVKDVVSQIGTKLGVLETTGEDTEASSGTIIRMTSEQGDGAV